MSFQSAPDGSEEVNSRIRAMRRGSWIPYKVAQDMLVRVQQLVEQGPSDRFQSFTILAPSNSGKTQLLRNIQYEVGKLYPAASEVVNGREIHKSLPVVLIQSPPEPSEDRLLDVILRQLGVLGSNSERPEHKIARIQATFRNLKVRLLLIDEFGFIQAGSVDKQRKALNGLKYLGNALRIPLVLSSVEDGVNALVAMPEIGSRYPAWHLPKWQANSEDTRLMLASIESTLGLKHASGLSRKSTTARFMAEATGTLGYMVELAHLLAEQAMRSGKERIDVDDLTPDVLKALGWIHPTRRQQRNPY